LGTVFSIILAPPLVIAVTENGDFEHRVGGLTQAESPVSCYDKYKFERVQVLERELVLSLT